MTHPAVIATVLVHDNNDGAAHVVERVIAQSRRPDAVVVVDNASRPPLDLGPHDHPVELVVIRCASNGGVGLGHNLAVRRALELGAERIWMLEHDSFPDDDCLERLLCTRAGLDGPCVIAPTLSRNNYERRWIERPGEHPCRVQALTWNGPLVDRAVFEQVGLLREDLFVGQEDHEFARAMSRAGLAIWCDPAAVVIHPNKGMHRFRTYESPDRVYYSVRNEIAVRSPDSRPRLPHRFTLAVRSVGELVRPGRGPRFVWARLQGAGDGLAGRLGHRRSPRRHQFDHPARPSRERSEPQEE